MAWQLIYTSAPRLLTAGQTGFGTVARHRDVPPLVVSAVERASQFARLHGMDAERVVFSHRIVDAAGARHHVLSRTASAGADYTGRTNHLAHHVILTAAEVADLAARRVSAADVMVRFPWRSVWSEGARWLEDHETPVLASLPLDRHEHLSAWTEATGQALHANHLVTGNGARSGCILIAPARVDMRRLFAESLRAVPEQGWQFTFTTELDPGDTPADFRWLGFTPGSPVLGGMQPGRRLVLDLTRPGSLPVAEPLPEKSQPSSPSASAGKRAGPPRVAAPAGGAFVEPPVELPPPLIAQMGASPGAAPAPLRRGKSARPDEGHDSSHGWRIVGLVVLAACAVLGVALLVSGKGRSQRRKPVPVFPDSVYTPPPPSPASAPSPPPSEVPPAVTTAPSVAPAPDSRGAAPTPGEGIVPLRAAHAAQLATVELPELRHDQTHLLITAGGAERGPLLESRGNLSLSLNDLSPVLKLNLAAHQAVWSASPDSSVVPPVQWRVLQDHKEVLRVLIGDGSQRQPLNATPVPSAQDESGVITGAFAALARRFGNQTLWLRLPADGFLQLRESGYGGHSFVPLRNLKADTSDIYSWLVKEQLRLQGILNATMPGSAPIAGTPAPVDSEFPGKSSAPRSKQTNTLENRTAPSSSVAGSMGAAQEQMRTAAQQRLDKLAELRGGNLLMGRFPATTCSFLAGPPGSTPENAVWICEVVFAPAASSSDQ